MSIEQLKNEQELVALYSAFKGAVQANDNTKSELERKVQALVQNPLYKTIASAEEVAIVDEQLAKIEESVPLIKEIVIPEEVK